MMSFLCVKIFVLRSIVGYDAKCLFLVEDVTKVFLKISLIKSYLLIPFHTDMNISKAISSLFILNFLPFLPLLFFTHSGPAVFHHFLFQLKAEIHLVSTKVINDPSHFFVNSIYTEAFSRHPRTYKNSCWLSKTRMKCSDTNVIMEWANREDVINLRTCSPGLTSSCQEFSPHQQHESWYKHTCSQSTKDSYRMVEGRGRGSWEEDSRTLRNTLNDRERGVWEQNG